MLRVIAKFGIWFGLALIFVASLGGAVGRAKQALAQAERPIVRPTEDCEWMYQKAREMALHAEQGNSWEQVLNRSNQSLAWSQLYLACRERNR